MSIGPDIVHRFNGFTAYDHPLSRRGARRATTLKGGTMNDKFGVDRRLVRLGGLPALKQVVPLFQMLFGTDYPYRSSAENTTGLTASNALGAKELEAIKTGNALRLLPRLQS
jgi:hypothetical protein